MLYDGCSVVYDLRSYYRREELRLEGLSVPRSNIYNLGYGLEEDAGCRLRCLRPPVDTGGRGPTVVPPQGLPVNAMEQTGCGRPDKSGEGEGWKEAPAISAISVKVYFLPCFHTAIIRNRW